MIALTKRPPNHMPCPADEATVAVLGESKFVRHAIVRHMWFDELNCLSQADLTRYGATFYKPVQIPLESFATYDPVEPPEISTIVDPDGFDIDDPESPINALAKAEERCRVLEEALKAIEGGCSADWLLDHDIEPDHYSVPNEKLDRARWNNCRAVARAALEEK